MSSRLNALTVYNLSEYGTLLLIQSFIESIEVATVTRSRCGKYRLCPLSLELDLVTLLLPLRDLGLEVGTLEFRLSPGDHDTHQRR